MLLILTGNPTGALELAGDARATFAAAPGSDGSTLLALSDGTLIAWTTTAERCRIQVLAHGAADIELDLVDEAEGLPPAQASEEAPDRPASPPPPGDAGPFESDLLTIDGRLRWIVHAGTCTPAAALRATRHR